MKRRRPTFRFGPGEFSPAGPNVVCRWLYLHAVSFLVPEALEELLACSPRDILAWATKRGFTDSWALTFATINAERWRAAPETRFRWSGVHVSYWMPDFPPAPAYDPTVSRDIWRQQLTAYQQHVIATPGLVKTPEKRTLVHFEWLALHHVGRRTYERIAEQYQDEQKGLTLDAVSKAIIATAKLVGLTLRSGPGRG